MEHFNIYCTDLAIEKLKEYLAKNQLAEAVRLGLRAGGCNGFSISFEADVEINDEDYIFIFDNIKIIVDPKSISFLNGTKVDFINSLNRYGFVFDVPKRTDSCSCGTSIKFEE